MIDRDAENLTATTAWLQAQPKLLLVSEGVVPRLSSWKFRGMLLGPRKATIFNCASDVVCHWMLLIKSQSDEAHMYARAKANHGSMSQMFASAEVRWFWRERCPQEIRDWFFKVGLPPGGGQHRIDRYIVRRREPTLSIKQRGDESTLEVKGQVTTRRNSGA